MPQDTPLNATLVYHPDTGTIVAAADCILVQVSDLPDDVESWETYLATSNVNYLDLEPLVNAAWSIRGSFHNRSQPTTTR